MRKCNKKGHKRSKPYPGGKTDCATCRRVRDKRYRLSPDYRQREKDNYAKDKLKPGYREAQSRRARKMKYGIEGFPPGTMCALCPKLATDIDHSHVTNKVRGFLCRYCNVRIGIIENKAWRKQGLRYLEKNENLSHRKSAESRSPITGVNATK